MPVTVLAHSFLSLPTLPPTHMGMHHTNSRHRYREEEGKKKKILFRTRPGGGELRNHPNPPTPRDFVPRESLLISGLRFKVPLAPRSSPPPPTVSLPVALGPFSSHRSKGGLDPSAHRRLEVGSFFFPPARHGGRIFLLDGSLLNLPRRECRLYRQAVCGVVVVVVAMVDLRRLWRLARSVFGRVARYLLRALRKLARLAASCSGISRECCWRRCRTARLSTRVNRARIVVWVTPGFSHVGIVPSDAAGRRVFSGISRFYVRAFRRFSIFASLHLHRDLKTSFLTCEKSYNFTRCRFAIGSRVKGPGYPCSYFPCPRQKKKAGAIRTTLPLASSVAINTKREAPELACYVLVVLRIGAAPGLLGRGGGGVPRENPPTSGIVQARSQLAKNPRVARPGIEPGSPWWEAGSLTDQPQRPLADWTHSNLATCSISFSLHRGECSNTPPPLLPGPTVSERLACSPPTRANRVQSPAESLPDFRMWESCWTMPLVGGFSRRSPVSLALSFRRCSILTPPHPHRLSKLRCYELPKYLHIPPPFF
ncbi:hypothetical protein PR048_007657 [Dryococelus australis]|uniref:Uncharacterized protein n=1 Tax=Dryococelus australis TaxID=614101 RepID=A0ABQ9HV31_9NEOP|nr:hypothetical protein PR048_007657 [Dryococelus australis]